MNKQILINGGLRAKQDNVVLTLYSTPLARVFINKKIKRVNINYENNLFTITPGTQRSISIERKEKQPLLILHVAKFIPKDLLATLKSEKKQKRIKVLIKNVAEKSDLLAYNNQIKYTAVIPDLNISIPEPEKIKVGCFISCSKNKSGFNYRLGIRHRILQEIALKRYLVALGRNKQGDFILRKNKRGRIFNFCKFKDRRVLAYMQISPSLITRRENKLFRSGRKAISYKAYLSSKEFYLDISRFFSTKDEKELAYAILKRGINVRIPEMRKREADIVLKDSGVQIEVTKLKPNEKKTHHNSPHTDGAHINARLCEGYLRVTKKIVPLYFVVINHKWLTHGWVKELISQVEPSVVCIATDFEDGWEEKVADKIKSDMIDRRILK